MARVISRNVHRWDEVVCPECRNDLNTQEDDLGEGEIVSCQNCGCQFEVMTNPFELRKIEDPGPAPRYPSQRPAA